MSYDKEFAAICEWLTANEYTLHVRGIKGKLTLHLFDKATRTEVARI